MIMTRTPLRITFVGGGTDLRSYYKEHGPGAVVNAAINKYIYIIVNKKFDDAIRVSYSKTEIVDSIDKIEHTTVREALRMLGIEKGIEIVSISDIPSRGTGLGSSSSFLVGLLNALHAWQGELASPKQLAEEAIHIKDEVLKEAEGKQDEYIAAYGGLQFIEFNSDETVLPKHIAMKKEDISCLIKHLQLMYTGKQRNASAILNSQAVDASKHVETYNKMRDLAYELKDKLVKGEWMETGALMHKNWLLKRTLQESISNGDIDTWYNKGINAGALGGKLIGAGGGGFLLFFTPPDKHEGVRRALPELKEIPFDFEPFGSRIIYVGE